VNNELESMWKGAVLSLFSVLSKLILEELSKGTTI
jgi:hypothetical protein